MSRARPRATSPCRLTLFTVEALTNVFKHAYPPGQPGGTIRVSLKPSDDNTLTLSIADKGVGLQDESPGGVGSRLSQAFAHQIAGKVVVAQQRGGGTTVSLTFRDPQSGIGAAKPSDAVGAL